LKCIHFLAVAGKFSGGDNGLSIPMSIVETPSSVVGQALDDVQARRSLSLEELLGRLFAVVEPVCSEDVALVIVCVRKRVVRVQFQPGSLSVSMKDLQDYRFAEVALLLLFDLDFDACIAQGKLVAARI
jgi:hypothetical protein